MDLGRPTVYSEDLVESILLRMYDGESIAEICRDDLMPARSTVMLWVAKDREGFSDRYAKAMEIRALYWADEILDIADDGSNDWMERNAGKDEEPIYAINGEAVSRSRLRVDSRKWLMSKLLPQFSDSKEPKKPEGEDLAAVVSKLLDKLPN